MISLDDLARDRGAIDQVPDGDVAALLERALLIVELLRARLVARAIPNTTDPRGEDDLVGAAEAASMLGVSKSWVEKHLEELPARRGVGGMPRWLRRDLQAWARSRPRYARR